MVNSNEEPRLIGYARISTDGQKLDRLGRSVVGIPQTLEEVKLKVADFRSLTEALDTRTVVGKAMINILTTMAQMERDLTIERTVAGQQAARERGKKMGKPISMTPERIEQAKKLLASGVSTNDIASKIGVSRAALYNWLSDRRGFSDTTDDLE